MIATIKGVRWVSLVDYPTQICTTIFYSGCNLRCGYCHNPQLVLDSTILPPIDPVNLLKKLSHRQKLVPAVCVSGGEPTLDPRLSDLIREIKTLGLKVKLDTNGTNPATLDHLLGLNLVDYVAMDIKAPWEKYSQVTGVPVNVAAIQESIALIRRLAPTYEFRTTVVPGLLDKADLITIGQRLAGAQKYVLQQFRPTHPLLDPKLELQQPYPADLLYQMAASLKNNGTNIEVRC